MSRISTGLYFDIVQFLKKYKEQVGGEELTMLRMVAGAYLLNEEVTSAAISEARGIIARHDKTYSVVNGVAFDPDDRAAIEAAVADPDPENPIAIALVGRLKELMGRYWRHATQLGRVPTELMVVRPRTVLDEVACQMFLQTIADTLDHKLTIVWVEGEADEVPRR